MARPSNTAERRRQITLALIEVMAREGYAGASMSQIARAAGLNQGLLHYHFKSKGAILHAVLDELAARQAERLEQALAAAGGAPEAELRAFIDAFLARGRGADPEALACWVVISAEVLRQPELKEPYRALLRGYAGRVAEIVGRGQEAGVFAAAADPGAVAAALLAGIQGHFVLAATAPELIPRGSAVPALWAQAEALLTCSAGR